MGVHSQGRDSVPFDHFRRELGEYSYIVDEIEQLYNQIEYPSLTRRGDEAAKEFAELEAAADEEVERAKASVAQVQQELEKVQREREMLKTATVEEMLEQNPELREEIDAEIERGEWY